MYSPSLSSFRTRALIRVEGVDVRELHMTLRVTQAELTVFKDAAIRDINSLALVSHHCSAASVAVADTPPILPEKPRTHQ